MLTLITAIILTFAAPTACTASAPTTAWNQTMTQPATIYTSAYARAWETYVFAGRTINYATHTDLTHGMNAPAGAYARVRANQPIIVYVCT